MKIALGLTSGWLCAQDRPVSSFNFMALGCWCASGHAEHSPLLADVLRAHAQTRALQTYVKRVYYPFLLRDPEIHALEGVLCALWVHTHPTLAGMPHAQTSLSVAVIVPVLSGLPAALAAVEDVIAGSGAHGLFCRLSRCRIPCHVQRRKAFATADSLSAAGALADSAFGSGQ